MQLYSEYSKLTEVQGLKHLVLTIRSEAGLGPGMRSNGKVMTSFDWIRYCFGRLRRRKLFKTAWRGGVYSIEVTYDPDKGWHVHIHALVVGDYVAQEVISKTWAAITGDSRITWIELAHSPKEALKYVLKPSSELLADPAALDDLLTNMRGVHFVGSWGDAWGKRMSPKTIFGHDDKFCCPKCGGTNILTLGPLSEEYLKSEFGRLDTG